MADAAARSLQYEYKSVSIQYVPIYWRNLSVTHFRDLITGIWFGFDDI